MAKNFKIPTKKIDSSDCIVHIGQVIEDDEIVDKGEPYAIHANEWVKLLPVMTMKESFALMKIANMGDTTSNADESLNEVCQSLANRIVDWIWTGIDGELLPNTLGGESTSQPQESVISIICEAFSCTPDIALQQNPQIVREVLEYRMAQATVEQFNDDASKMTPEMVEMMKRLQESLNEE